MQLHVVVHGILVSSQLSLARHVSVSRWACQSSVGLSNVFNCAFTADSLLLAEASTIHAQEALKLCSFLADLEGAVVSRPTATESQYMQEETWGEA